MSNRGDSHSRQEEQADFSEKRRNFGGGAARGPVVRRCRVCQASPAYFFCGACRVDSYCGNHCDQFVPKVSEEDKTSRRCEKCRAAGNGGGGGREDAVVTEKRVAPRGWDEAVKRDSRPPHEQLDHSKGDSQKVSVASPAPGSAPHRKSRFQPLPAARHRETASADNVAEEEIDHVKDIGQALHGLSISEPQTQSMPPPGLSPLPTPNPSQSTAQPAAQTPATLSCGPFSFKVVPYGAQVSAKNSSVPPAGDNNGQFAKNGFVSSKGAEETKAEKQSQPHSHPDSLSGTTSHAKSRWNGKEEHDIHHRASYATASERTVQREALAPHHGDRRAEEEKRWPSRSRRGFMAVFCNGGKLCGRRIDIFLSEEEDGEKVVVAETCGGDAGHMVGRAGGKMLVARCVGCDSRGKHDQTMSEKQVLVTLRQRICALCGQEGLHGGVSNQYGILFH
eukprot:gene3666-4012_t